MSVITITTLLATIATWAVIWTIRDSRQGRREHEEWRAADRAFWVARENG